MISDMLAEHPDILTMSEFFIGLGMKALRPQPMSGGKFWNYLSTQSAAYNCMMKQGILVDETLYDFEAKDARYVPENIPPIMVVALPHLTENHHELFDELGTEIRGLPKAPAATQYERLFDILGEKLNRSTVVERSGGSLMLTPKLLELFPDAKIVHVYRDGRDTAMSMSKHYNFQFFVGLCMQAKSRGTDPFKDLESPKVSAAKIWLQNLAFSFVDAKKMAQIPTLSDFGWYWSESIALGNRLLSRLPEERVLQLKFEDVQDSPREELEKLLHFVNPDLESGDWLDKVSGIPRPARSKFSNLDSDELKSLQTACKEGLDILGYS